MIRIGTRGSKLALWQAEWVKARLSQHGLNSEIIPIETKGDKILDVSIAKIGSKGVFTEEIERQLLEGKIDLAVHSAKDMQSRLSDPFELIAFGEREKANDVLVAEKRVSLNDRIRVGTSSTRRVAFLKHHFPMINVVPMRGNLQTRIRKMREGDCDALLLAYAGVNRMGYDSMIVEELPLSDFIPAVGQGSVAIEICTTMEPEQKKQLRTALNHDLTERQLLAERAFLRTMDGGCSIPVFGLATLQNNELILEGGIVSLDGKEMIRMQEQGQYSEAESIGERLANRVLKAGGDRILREIRQVL